MPNYCPNNCPNDSNNLITAEITIENNNYFYLQQCRKVENVGVPVVNGGQNLSLLVGIGLTDLANIHASLICIRFSFQ